MLTFALLACSDDPTTPEQPTPTGSIEGTVLVPPDEHPEVLRAVEGWWLTGVEVLGDLDADGAVDFRVTTHDGALSTTFVVRGPLAGQVLPEDAWFAQGWGGWIHRTGDVDGDGLVDLLWEGDQYGIVFGPIDGPPPPEAITEWRTALYDVDRDGILDKVESTRGTYYDDWLEQIEVTWGPLARFSGPPDVVVGPLCRNEFDYDGTLWEGTEVFTPGDLDGDGQPELSLDSYGNYGSGDCGDFTVSLPRAGTVEPFESLGTADRLVTDDVIVGDVTGDGLDEVMTATTVLASPIDVAPGALTGREEVALAAELLHVYPFASTGPLGIWGILDTRVVAPIADLQGFGAFQAETAWEIGPRATTSEPFVEDGRVKFAFVDERVLRLADIAPAD